ncbi:GNAT family N-acetyltransferase [Terribacillus sp. 179-K 1B1 HS]|uniref:GNAT family N-acetyltransferase n=1 Tax=Terribacillus sp. 179-K 1B1 HS TaxID=3142388 RepID=UPI0039A31D75
MKVNNESIELAKSMDLESIQQLFDESSKELQEEGIFQWDENYPNRDYFKVTIGAKELYVLKIDGRVMGAVVLNEWQSPEWKTVNWRNKNGNNLIVHTFCIHPRAQGTGYGGKILKFAEEMALKQGYTGIRLDAFSKNENALVFYEKKGYVKVGEIKFQSKPINDQLYFCFDKIFNK